jgi:prepilin-type N-terminal cleavage/methylation domain-containing protein
MKKKLSRLESTRSCGSDSQRGFTLIEIMCAVAILSVSLLGLASVAAYAINNNSGGRSRELGLAIAQQRLERMRNTDFASFTAGTTTEDVTSDGMRFILETTICASSTCSSEASAAQKVITIKVTPVGTASQWAGTDATDSKSVVVTTYRVSKVLGSN